MKRKSLLFALLLLQITAAFAHAQIAVQKSTFVAKETNTFHANPQVAVNTKSGQTLVIWQKATSAGSQILSRVVNSAGNAITGQVTLAAGPAVGHPSVAYNPVRNEFYLAYDDNPSVQLARTNIYVLRLSPQGKVGGAPVKITTDAISTEMANFYPKVIFNPKNNGYSVIWLREIITAAQASQGNNGLVGVALTGTAGLASPVTLIWKTGIEGSRLWGPVPLDLAYVPGNNKFLVNFVQVASGTNSTQANYYMATLDPLFAGVTEANSAKVNANPLLLSATFAWGAKFAMIPGKPSLLFFTDTNNIKKRKIDLQGKLSGAQTVAFKAPKNNTKMAYPSVAFVTNAKGTRGVLVATQDAFKESGGATTWAQVIDVAGVPIGAPVKVDTTAGNDTSLTGVVSGLPAKATDTLFRFSWYTTQAQFKAPAQTFETSGILKVNLNLTTP